MSTPKYNFIFLLHVSRSGSTYLARLLAENCNDLAVISETNYFRIIIAHQKIYKKYQPEKLTSLIMEDPKFKGFQFKNSEIKNAFLKCKTHKEAIFQITEMILDKLDIKNVRNVLIKDGGLIDFIPEIQEHFSHFKIIHIARDPRACINSLLHTPKAFLKGKSSMGWDNIEMCTKHYGYYMYKMASLKRLDLNILTVSYENLINDKEEEVKNVLNFLELQFSEEDKNKTKNYLRRQEHKIHRNIFRPVQKERLNAWESELKRWEIVYIESKLKNFITQSTIKYSSIDLIQAKMRAKKSHSIGMLYLTVYRLRRYLLKGDLSMFFLKLRLRFAK